MTEPVPEESRNYEAELDDMLSGIMFRLGVDDLQEARGRFRRALMFAWYDGQSAGLNAARQDFQGRPNPWLKSDNAS